MADRVEFVDSIAAFPTILLNLNDETTWSTRSFDAPPPRKRRTVASNAMRDGGVVSSSTYDMRVLTLTLDVRNSTQDANATELQKLARILDGPSILKYRPDTATAPVFFKVYPSDLAAVVDMYASTAYRQLTIELLAEPFALGLRTTISAGAVANTAPYFDVASASIAGDAPAPFLLVDGTPTPSTTTSATAHRFNWLLASTTEQATSQPTIIQCESLTLGTDTAVSGGNARQTPTGTSMATRMTYTTTGATARALRGSFRLYVATSMNSGTTGATLTVQAKYGSNAVADLSTGVVYTQSFDPTGSERWLIDLGTVSFDAPESVDPAPRIEVQASVSTTTGPPTVDYDFLILVPLDEATMTAQFASSTAAGAPSLGTALIIDGEQEAVYSASNTSVFSTAALHYQTFTVSGRFPMLTPNAANRFIYARYSTQTGAPPSTGYNNAASGTVTLSYMPRYLHVRPATT